MNYTISVYDALLGDLTAGDFTAATVIDAALLRSTYTFDAAHASITAVASHEVADAGYARFADDAVFTLATVDGEVHYTALSPVPTFPAVAIADWRYLVLFDHATGALYLCLDSGQANAALATDPAVTVEPGSDPYLRLLAP